MRPAAWRGTAHLRWLRQAAERARTWLGTAVVCLPGILVAAIVAAAARAVSLTGVFPVPEVPIAVAVGLVLGTLGRLPARLHPGLRVAAGPVLRLAIVLIGAQLSLQVILDVVAPAIALVLSLMALAGVASYLASRILSLPPRLALLIAVGTAVCGNTAIASTGPIVRATEREVSYAVAVITLIGTAALFIFPVIGTAIGLTQSQFGFWAGTAIHDTSQVIAAGSSYGAAALGVAVVVKLTRNAMLFPILLVISIWRRTTTDPSTSAMRAAPWFVFGFLAMVSARTFGLIDSAVADSLSTAARFGILAALAGMAMNVSVGSLMTVGPKPLFMGLAVALLLSIASLLAMQLVI